MAMFAVMPLTPPLPQVPIGEAGTIVGPPPSITAAHRFGVAVAIDHDRLAVGVDGRRDGPPDAGAVVVYRRSRGMPPRWRLDRVVRSPAGNTGDGFGASLALDGDRLVVGAPDTDDRCGAAWLIELDDPTSVPRRLLIPDATPGSRVGESVAIAGDLIVIGAPHANHAGFLDRGRVWCLGLDEDATPRGAEELEPPISLTGLRFGASIAIGPSIAVGATGADVPGDPHAPEVTVDRAGEILLFAKAPPFDLVGVRRRDTPGPLDRTGTAIAWREDTLVAGSPRADCGGERGGVITVFGIPSSERHHPCRPNGGTGSRLSIGGGRLAATVPGRRGTDGRLDGSVLIGDVDAEDFTPRLEFVSIARGPLLFDVAVSPDGDRLAVGAARDHEDAAASGVVWVVEFAPMPVAAAADQDEPSSGG
jgi:hypothetical protein